MPKLTIDVTDDQLAEFEKRAKENHVAVVDIIRRRLGLGDKHKRLLSMLVDRNREIFPDHFTLTLLAPGSTPTRLIDVLRKLDECGDLAVSPAGRGVIRINEDRTRTEIEPVHLSTAELFTLIKKPVAVFKGHKPQYIGSVSPEEWKRRLEEAGATVDLKIRKRPPEWTEIHDLGDGTYHRPGASMGAFGYMLDKAEWKPGQLYAVTAERFPDPDDIHAWNAPQPAVHYYKVVFGYDGDRKQAEEILNHLLPLRFSVISLPDPISSVVHRHLKSVNSIADLLADLEGHLVSSGKIIDNIEYSDLDLVWPIEVTAIERPL